MPEENQNLPAQTAEKQTNNLSSLPPLKELFRQSWEIFTKSLLNLFLLLIVNLVANFFLLLIGILFFVALGFGSGFWRNLQEMGLSAFASLSPSTYILGGAILVLLCLVSFVINTITRAASIIVVAESEQGTSISQALRRSFPSVIPLFLIGLLTSFFLIGGLALFILPAVLFSFFFLFASYEVVLNQQGFYRALQRSVLFISRRFGEILIRVLALAFLYLFLFILLPGLIRKVSAEASLYLAFISVIVNFLAGWYGLSFMVALYQQAKSGLEEEEGGKLIWIWILSLLGWLIILVGLFAGYKLLRSQFAKRIFEKARTQKSLQQTKITPTKASEVDKLIKSGNLKLSTANQLAQKPNLTEGDREQIRGLINGAITDFRKATEIEPSSPGAWYNLGKAYGALIGTVKDAEKWAISAYKRAISLKSDNYLFYLGLGGVYFKQKDYEKAIENFQKVVELEPNLANGYFNLGVAYKKVGAKEEARKTLQETLELLPPGHKDRYKAERELSDL